MEEMSTYLASGDKLFKNEDGFWVLYEGKKEATRISDERGIEFLFDTSENLRLALASSLGRETEYSGELSTYLAGGDKLFKDEEGFSVHYIGQECPVKVSDERGFELLFDTNENLRLALENILG